MDFKYNRRRSSRHTLSKLRNSQKKADLIRKIAARNVKDDAEVRSNLEKFITEASSYGRESKEFNPSEGTYGDFPIGKRKQDPDNHSVGSLIPKKPRGKSKESITLQYPGTTQITKVVKKAEGNTTRTGSITQQGYGIYTSMLRSQISKFFGNERGQPSLLKPITMVTKYFDPLQKTIEPYMLKIFSQELENETRHYKITTTKELEKQLAKRSEMVSWILKTGDALEVLPQTLHLATYIIDAYLRLQYVPTYSLELFAAAALCIAAKQEETDYMLTSSDFLKYCSPGINFIPRRLVSTESRILSKLKFRICCPTAHFFMDACASQMTYCDNFARTYCIELAEKILLDALRDAELMFAPNSKKARLALHYAAKYISFNYDLLRLVHGKDEAIWSKFSSKCFPEFKAATLNGITLPKIIFSHSSSIKAPSALRDVTNKCKLFSRQSQSRSDPNIVTRSRLDLN